MGRCLNNHGIVSQGKETTPPPPDPPYVIVDPEILYFDGGNNPCNGTGLFSVESDSVWVAVWEGTQFSLFPDTGGPGVTEVLATTDGTLMPLSVMVYFEIASVPYGTLELYQLDTDCPGEEL